MNCVLCSWEVVGRETRESNAQGDGKKKRRDLGKNGKGEGNTGIAGEMEEGALGQGGTRTYVEREEIPALK